MYIGHDDTELRRWAISKGLDSKEAGNQQSVNRVERASNQLDKVVDYCMNVGCRRKALLAHFGEVVPAKSRGTSTSCCDVCSNKADVAAMIQEVHASLSGQRTSTRQEEDDEEDDQIAFRRVMAEREAPQTGDGGSNAHVRKPEHLTTATGEGKAASFASKIARKYANVDEPGFVVHSSGTSTFSMPCAQSLFAQVFGRTYSSRITCT
jgi:superfamily II DNA helicase RecQ